jgi:hypothetical protein
LIGLAGWLTYSNISSHQRTSIFLSIYLLPRSIGRRDIVSGFKLEHIVMLMHANQQITSVLVALW